MLDAAAFCRGLVEEGTVYAFLAEHRKELFKEEDFLGLFPSGRGRPSTPVQLICSMMVLQALEGLSDRDAIRQLRNRLDWKVACGLALDNEGSLSRHRTQRRLATDPRRCAQSPTTAGARTQLRERLEGCSDVTGPRS
jgi:hypothetical protein